MMRYSMRKTVTVLLLFGTATGFSQPIIQSLGRNGQLRWTNNVTGKVSVIERSLSLSPASWEPFFYDWATNGPYSTPLPLGGEEHGFYRIGVLTNFPDTNLMLHLSFDNVFSNGTVLDISGHGNHGIRYSLTNWPSVVGGIAGVQAAHYRRPDPVMQGNEQHGYADYIAVTNWNGIAVLTNGTISIWAWFDTNSYAATALLDAGYNVIDAMNPAAATDSWSLQRTYSANLQFVVNLAGGSFVKVSFPDDTIYNGGNSTYATTNWHWYGVTWNAQSNQIIGYYDGNALSTNSMDAPYLRIYSPFHWLAVGCQHHEGSPQMDYGQPGGDMYPNNGWMGGSMDDVRIYNQALSGAEMAALYSSFDKLPPSTPTNIIARVVSSTQTELRWDHSLGVFGIAGYRLYRNGVLISDMPGTIFVDAGLSTNTAYTYTIEAYDAGGNVSPTSDPVVLTTEDVGSGVDAIVDNLDGEPWVKINGAWTLKTGGGFWNSFLQDDNAGKGSKSVEFHPLLPEAGNYNIYMWFYTRVNGSSAVPVDIIHDGTTNTVTVNQTSGGDSWELIALANIPAGTNTTIRVRNDPYGYIEADAFRFTK
jgi:hypothetical protein